MEWKDQVLRGLPLRQKGQEAGVAGLLGVPEFLMSPRRRGEGLQGSAGELHL